MKRGDCVVITLEERTDMPGKFHSGAEVVEVENDGTVWVNHETQGMPLQTMVLSGKAGEAWRPANDREAVSIRRLREGKRDMRVKTSGGFWSRVCDNHNCKVTISGPVWRDASGREFHSLECKRGFNPNERNETTMSTKKTSGKSAKTPKAPKNQDAPNFRPGTSKHDVFMLLSDYKYHSAEECFKIADDAGKTRQLVRHTFADLQKYNLLEADSTKGYRMLKTPDPNAKWDPPSTRSSEAEAPAPAPKKADKAGKGASEKADKKAGKEAAAPTKKAPTKKADGKKDAKKAAPAKAEKGNGKPKGSAAEAKASKKRDAAGKAALADHEAKTAAGAPAVTVQ